MRIGWLIAAGLAVVQANAALACSPIPPSSISPSQDEVDASRRADYAQALDLVDFVVVKRASGQHRGLIRVTRSYKGRMWVGQVLTIWTEDHAMRGAGDAESGIRERMFLSGRGPYRYWPMGDAQFADLVRLGLVSP